MGGKKGKGTKGGKERKMHFTVPDGVNPGETLKLMTPRGGEVEVEVPADAKVGKSFAVTIPASSSPDNQPKKEATRISVTVPQGAKPGQVIKGMTPAGREFDVAVPAGVKPGKTFLVMVPLEASEVEEANKANSDTTGAANAANAAAMMKQMTKGKKMSGAQAAAMQAMLGPLMDTMFGGDTRHY